MDYSKNKLKGNIGENIASKYLKKYGFELSKRNYRKPWGELDIIAFKDNVVHFFEVKSVTVKHFPDSTYSGKNVGFYHRPEENVDAFKLKQIRKMVRTYFSECCFDDQREFQFHIICVYMDPVRRLARIRWMKNLVL